MKRVCANIKDLVWENAVDVLSVNEMDVDKACYAVQCEWLQPVYESINSEHKKVKQEEMEELKNLLLSHKDDKEIFSKEVSFFCFLGCHVTMCCTRLLSPVHVQICTIIFIGDRLTGPLSYADGGV